VKVLLDHDGAVEDLVTLALLASSPEVDLIGVVCTPGDGYLEASVPASRAVLDIAGLSHVPVAAGSVEPANPFPERFRVDGGAMWERVASLAAVDRSTLRAPQSDLPGHELAAEAILATAEPVVVVATGPLTSFAEALNEDPDVEDHVARLYWMGGAIDVPGNVDQPGHDGSAEWNAYADPRAAARVWDSNIDLYVCPLDATNHVPLTPELISRIGACGDRSALARFAAEAYGSVDPSLYYIWDVLTAAWMLEPDILTAETVPCEVLVDGESAGRTNRQMAGRAITAALDCDAEAALDAIVRRLCEGRG
jgi:purine nucleosidase